jgi:hypothetical protein
MGVAAPQTLDKPPVQKTEGVSIFYIFLRMRIDNKNMSAAIAVSTRNRLDTRAMQSLSGICTGLAALLNNNLLF